MTADDGFPGRDLKERDKGMIPGLGVRDTHARGQLDNYKGATM